MSAQPLECLKKERSDSTPIIELKPENVQGLPCDFILNLSANTIQRVSPPLSRDARLFIPEAQAVREMLGNVAGRMEDFYRFLKADDAAREMPGRNLAVAESKPIKIPDGPVMLIVKNHDNYADVCRLVINPENREALIRTEITDRVIAEQTSWSGGRVIPLDLMTRDADLVVGESDQAVPNVNLARISQDYEHKEPVWLTIKEEEGSLWFGLPAAKYELEDVGDRDSQGKIRQHSVTTDLNQATAIAIDGQLPNYFSPNSAKLKGLERSIGHIIKIWAKKRRVLLTLEYLLKEGRPALRYLGGADRGELKPIGGIVYVHSMQEIENRSWSLAPNEAGKKFDIILHPSFEERVIFAETDPEGFRRYIETNYSKYAKIINNKSDIDLDAANLSKNANCPDYLI